MLPQMAMSKDLSVFKHQRKREVEELVLEFADLVDGKNSLMAMEALSLIASLTLRQGWKNNARQEVLRHFHQTVEQLVGRPE